MDYEECGPGVSPLPIRAFLIGSAGQGIASQLTLAVLEDLKRQGLKVVPAVSIHGPLYSAASGVEADGWDK